ncbi:MAG TPA: 6,7-dimethyl-8-ribityllumazine synthase [Pirellulales bacterium]
MPTVIEGVLQADPSDHWAVVVSRYNETITKRLLAGAVETLVTHGAPDAQIDVVYAPGAFEIPVIASGLAASGKYAAVICLGAVIRGETTHDEHINRAVSLQFAELGVRYGLPVLFGVLTVNSIEQAFQRAGGTVGNKGAECALAALETASVLKRLPKRVGKS